MIDGFARLSPENRQLVLALHCPSCAAALTEVELGDVFLLGLECREGHRYFVPLVSPGAGVSDKARTIQGPHSASATESQIIHAWLTEEPLRRYLNTFLAVTLRRIREVGIRSAAPATKFRRCPLCSEELSANGTDMSGWQNRLVCMNGHVFHDRQSLNWHANGEIVDLFVEFDDAAVVRNARFYLREDVRSNVPDDVRRILMAHLSGR